MKVRISPAPSPYREADPRDVVVTSVERSFVDGSLVAWGYLRSEMRISRGICTTTLEVLGLEPGPEYIVGSSADGERWYQEGTINFTLLDEHIVQQITDGKSLQTRRNEA
jgi:hypothetical protein